MKFGALFAAARKRMGWSLRDVETLSGVDYAAISRIERGIVGVPGWIITLKLAAILEITNEDLRACEEYKQYKQYKRGAK